VFQLGQAARYNEFMRSFHFVDFAAHYQRGFRNHIVSITDVPALIKSFEHYGCYATYFFYSDEVLTYMSAQNGNGSPSIAGYEGKVWAPFVPIDLDHTELLPALEAARRLSALFLERWAIDPGALQIYFSGFKGFHILLDTRLFGRIAPSKNLPTIFDSIRRHLVQELPEPLRETVDLSIKDRVRLLRLPNTIHEKSKLNKIILNPAELDYLNPGDLCELARTPRALTLTDETGFLSRTDVTTNAAASEMFHRIRRQASRLTRKPFAFRFRRPADLTKLEFPCAGAQKIWQSHIEHGERNNCAIRLVSELRLLGLTEEEAREKLFEWNERNSIELPAAELQSVVHSGYQHRFPYRYGCRDAILRRYCPLPDLKSCRALVADRNKADASTG
jgi:Primase C terminal 1 (PriCT-1)